MRAERGYFQGLTRSALIRAKLERLNRVCNLKQDLKEVSEELTDAKSDLREIDALLKAGLHPVQFPAAAPAAEPEITEPTIRAKRKRA